MCEAVRKPRRGRGGCVQDRGDAQFVSLPLSNVQRLLTDSDADPAEIAAYRRPGSSPLCDLDVAAERERPFRVIRALISTWTHLPETEEAHRQAYNALALENLGWSGTSTISRAIARDLRQGAPRALLAEEG